MSTGEWIMHVEGGLEAHFKEADGQSRPGTDWAIVLKRGAEVHRVRVRALLADDATKATRRDEHYQAQTAMQYLNDQLASGWHPSQAREHTIHIGNPRSTGTSDPSPRPVSPWWKFW